MYDRQKYLRNDGCLATRQLLGVARSRGLDWPSPQDAEPVPPRATLANHQHQIPDGGRGTGSDSLQEELCREETTNAQIRCAIAATEQGCSAMGIYMDTCCDMANPGDPPPLLLQKTGCHCSCGLYAELLRGLPKQPPGSLGEPCVPIADLPPGFVHDGEHDYTERVTRLPCHNYGICENPQQEHPHCTCVDGWGGPTCEDPSPDIPNPGTEPGAQTVKACRYYLNDWCNPLKMDFPSVGCNECVAQATTVLPNPCLQWPQEVLRWCEAVEPHPPPPPAPEPHLPPPPAPEPQPPREPHACRSITTCIECEVHAAQQGNG